MSRDEIRAALAEALVIAHEGRIAALTAENERLRADLVRAQVSALTGISEADVEGGVLIPLRHRGGII